MRDEKEISLQIESNADKLFGKDWLTKLAYSAGYMDGIAYADNHPNWEEIVERMRKEITNDLRNDRWISVEDELPPKKSEYDDLSNNVLATDGKEIYESVYNHDFEDWFTHDMWGLDNITHWCYLPQLPVLSNSENTGKDLKGGEE